MKSEKNMQPEALETRLNLSTMHMRLGERVAHPIVTAAVSHQPTTKVMTIATEIGSSRPTMWWTKDQGGGTSGRSKTPAPVIKHPPKKPVKTPTAPQTTPILTTPAVVAPVDTTPQVVAPDPLASILAQLHGDDIHDDSATIQLLVDTANANGIGTITLPAGTFLLNRSINLYGTGITITGQGASTILDVNNHFTGTGDMGVAFNIQATLNPTPLMIVQPVTANTITFRGKPSLQVGQLLYLSNGLGSTALLEARAGGTDTGPEAFKEDGPDEYVTIASISTNAQGNTVATLTHNVIGTNDYFNVAPGGVTSGQYLHASATTAAADHLTVENLNIKFKDMQAQSAILSKFTNALTIQNVTVLNQNLLGSGNFDLVGGTGTTVSNVNCPSTIGLNSSRLASITNCTARSITLEEACTDNLIAHNTLTGTTSCDFRINDMACQRNVFEYNTLHGGIGFSGAIGIQEGVDTTIAFNTISGGNTEIWTGRTKGTIVQGNIGGGFADSLVLNLSQVFNNSWQ